MTKEELLKMSKEEILRNKSCRDCPGCTDCYGCTLCIGCHHCTQCYGCAQCQECTYSGHCLYCYDCDNCLDCIGCAHQTHKQYMFNDIQLTKEEYEMVKERIE